MVLMILEKLEKLQCIEVVNAVNINGETSLILAIKSSEDGVPEVIDALLKKGAEVTTKDHSGNTPLHLAASLG